mmetsp:Transcript_25781/g.41688  ORF Transcript_25781/g.41688 Transcript_25781/m.41688 type:complete len:646 (+) Transcript_25781:450-2387(+)|eukprot:CAMPEP_0203754166 /NCGR_PEP_ID=MMETSP0098-20131031/7807_1 /ASSEMBLY_ACC=CAM_ASM_000208 /TAXON_ID=96639 /ORGANISM=" , Strain NY0313808BC1" /LENGTH=645 /DNA_ID=CAMNT_0050645055 /DNA_START=372 /DNA_END=2309 /DNA_ORIENTATION=-
MLMNKSGSYYEEYRRSKGKDGSGKLEDERLLTDRAAYITFLEVQLERVSSACLTSQSFSDRIEGIQASVLNSEEKINNISRGLNLIESSSKVVQAECQTSVRTVQSKIDKFDAGIDTVQVKTESCLRSVDSLRLDVEQFEERHQVLVDTIKRRLEQKLLDFASRLELQEARSKSNESNISNLGNVTRTETQNSIASMQNQLDLTVKAIKEDQELRSSALAARLDSVVESVKHIRLDEDGKENVEGNRGRIGARSEGLSIQAESNLRDRIDDTRNELLDRSEENITRVMGTLRDFEQRTNQAQAERERSGLSEQRKVRETLASLSSRMNHLEEELKMSKQQNAQLTRTVEKLKSEQKHVSSSESKKTQDYVKERVSKALDVHAEHLEGLIQMAIREQNKTIRGILNAVEKKLKAQSDLVSDSMVRIEDFMDLYDATQHDLQERLDQGKRHQEKLNKLLEKSTLDEEPKPKAGSPFKVAFDELRDIVQSMGESGTTIRAVKKKKKTTSKKSRRIPKRNRTPRTRRSLSAERFTDSGSRRTAVRFRSRTPPPFEKSMFESVGRTELPDGGGKRGRDRRSMSSASFQGSLSDPEPGSNAAEEALHCTVPDTRSVADTRPPWNAPIQHPLNSPARKERIKQLYKSLSSNH